VRSNLGFEGLTLWPNGLTLFAMNEEALAQDGPIATQAEGTTVRLNRWDLGTDGWQPGPEGAYRTDPIFAAPNPAGSFADNGVSDILPARQYWPEFDLLVMERSFVTGVGNDVKLFGANFSRTTRTERREALPYPYDLQPADKRLIARMADLGVKADNLEGMTYGPRLPNGDPTLLIISDDNFSSVGSEQINQFVLLELLDTRPPEGTAVATQPATQPAAPAPQPAAAPAAQPAAQPVRPPAPAQIPSALPRTGELPFDATLLAFGGALLALGARLRRR
jgi:hypothetical protein